jgi:CheY-like chemotaxis protein
VLTLMKTRLRKTRLLADERSAEAVPRLSSPQACGGTILLITNDRRLHENLRSWANEAGLMVVRIDRAVGAAQVLRAFKPAAVVLDLDFPDEAPWATAEILLNKPDCPAVVFLTGRTDDLSMQSAITAGLVIGKGDSASRMLDVIEDNLEMSAPIRAKRNALRQELIRWLRPPAWNTDSNSCRFWRINE